MTTDRRDPRGEIPRSIIVRIANHFKIAGSAATVSRLDTEHAPFSWSSIYRVEGSFSWEELQVIFQSVADDDVILAGVGDGRGCQVTAEFELEGLGHKRGRFARREIASLSAAESWDTSLFQAATVAEDWYNRYEGAHVIGVMFYFR